MVQKSDALPNEDTGLKESKIWGMLYNFQKDAASPIINKLEKYNGCILAIDRQHHTIPKQYQRRRNHPHSLYIRKSDVNR